MKFTEVSDQLTKRLDAGKDAAHGWFLITRFHISDSSQPKALCEYLYARAGSHRTALDAADYDRLAAACGVTSANPGSQLRRHHLLALVHPLRLLRRHPASKWDEVELTPAGIELANASEPGDILERALSQVVFCKDPWFAPSRVKAYGDFDLLPYEATKSVLGSLEGWIDRDEWDLFVSRIRRNSEIPTAVSCIESFRVLSAGERTQLLNEVKSRLTPKTYQNWRDVGLHTFSLFNLGTSMFRDGTRLLLASALVPPAQSAAGGVMVPPQQPPPQPPKLKTPSAPDGTDGPRPPTDPQANSGASAEAFVAKILKADGWSVAFYASRRGYGFDIYATRKGRVWFVEVKSSTADMGAIVLTASEYAAAKQYGKNYLIAVVEDVGKQPKVGFVPDPYSTLTAKVRGSTEYVFARTDWLGVATSGS